VDASAKVVIAGAAKGARDYRLTLTARGSSSVREVAVPDACNDRAAVIAVVIDALVAPYFWPAGKPRPASEPTTQPVETKSALDFLLAASVPASMPVASAPVSAPTTLPSTSATATLPVASSEEGTPALRVVPMAFYASAAPDFALAERTRGRFALGFAVGAPTFIRWFVELSFLTLRSVEYQSGRIDYGEGHAMVGADVALIAGWFAGIGAGLQVLHAVANGFDTNRSATLVGPSFEVRTGYRHVFASRFELGGQLLLRADLFQQRLLVDDVAVATLLPIHVGAALTAGVLF
jgi:hypothetical protein